MNPLFAVRSIWMVIFVVLAVIGACWFVYRVVVDAAVWVKEEIIDDIKERKRKKLARKSNPPGDEGHRKASG